MSSVIIVDDQATNRKVISKLASALDTDVAVTAFADPLRALSYASQNTPDLVITDYKMPQITGAEMIARLRALPNCAEVPALVVTAYEDIEYRTRAMEAGANDFILSPLNHVEFRMLSRKLLAMRHELLAATFHSPKADGESLHQLAKPADGQIDMFNGLLEGVAARLLHQTTELQRVNTELQNLLELSATPAIFVDGNLHIRRFTPQIATIFDPTALDIGRSLSGVNCMLMYNNLIRDFRQVTQSGQTVERYLEHKTSNARYLLRMIPNQYGDNSPSGATLIFSDVTAWYSATASNRPIH